MRPASTSPTVRTTSPGRSAAAANALQIPSLLQRAVAPSSHSTFSAFFPSNAAHVPVATTATPLEIWTTCCTPGTASAVAGSKVFTRPPNTGQRATAACTMPGTRTSTPKIAAPLTLSGVSSRGMR